MRQCDYQRKNDQQFNLMQYPDDVQRFSDRDKEIVRLYMDTDLTYRVIGEKYNLSGGRISQIIARYISKCQGYWENGFPITIK